MNPVGELTDSTHLVEHFTAPRNVGSLDPDNRRVGTGMVGAPADGNVLKLQIRVDDTGTISDARFRTYGCGFAIATTSWLTEWVKGKSLAEARTLSGVRIAEFLRLPPAKLHCSLLAEDVLAAAIDDYQRKQTLPGS